MIFLTKDNLKPIGKKYISQLSSRTYELVQLHYSPDVTALIYNKVLHPVIETISNQIWVSMMNEAYDSINHR